MYDRKKFRSAQNVTDVSFFVVIPLSSRILRMSFLPKNLLKKSFQNVKNIMLVHLRKMALKKMLSLLNVINPLILALQMKCK